MDPVELVVVGGIATVLLIFGQEKIVEYARGLGGAKKEFEMATKRLIDQ